MYSRDFLIHTIIDKMEDGKPISFVIPKEKRFSVSHQEHNICIFSYKAEVIELTKENIYKVMENLKVSDNELYNIVIDLYC